MKYLVKGHENPDVDSVVSGYLLTKVLNTLGYDAEFIIPDVIGEETLGICLDFGFNPSIYQVDDYDKSANFILVDHFQDDEDNIVGIVDHHKNNIEIIKCDYWYDSASSVSLMIAEKYENILNRQDILLACLATFVDTVSFHSTKSRKSDRDWIDKMCQKYNLDYNRLYNAGLCMTDITNLDKVIFNGMKSYVFNNYRVESSYIQIKEISEGQIDYMLSVLKEYVASKDKLIFVFIVHDLNEFTTKVYKISKNNIEIEEYNQYTARGDGIIAKLSKTLK